MTLDESVDGDEDEVFEFNDITFVMEHCLRETLGEVSVDYAPETGVVVRGTRK